MSDKSLPALQHVRNVNLFATASHAAEIFLPISGLLGPVRLITVAAGAVPMP